MEVATSPSIVASVARQLTRWRATRLLRRHASAYATLHDMVPTTALPTLKDWTGLLAYVTIVRREAAGELLLVYWRTREDFERHAPRFTLQIGACKDEGYASDPHETWLRRLGRYVSYNTVVLTLVAILGALQALGVYGNWIFLRPALHVSTTRPTLQYVAGDAFRELLRIANRTAVAHRRIEITAARIDDATQRRVVELAPSSKSLGTLPPGTNDDVYLHGIAPRLPGKYTLQVEIASVAGWIRGVHPQPFTREVEVWDALPHVASIQTVNYAPTRVELASTVEVGRAAPNGLDCECVLREHPGVRILVAYPRMTAASTQLSPNTTPGAEVTSVQWHAPKSDGLERISFGIVLWGKQLDRQIGNFMKVNCYATPEPPIH